MGVTKRDFQVVYVDVILAHIKTRLDLLGIQPFRWDQRLGPQYSKSCKYTRKTKPDAI